MTSQKLLDVLKVYDGLLVKRGATAQRIEEREWRVNSAGRVEHVQTTLLQQESHLLWMCREAAGFVSEDRIEKAMRWLGFIQGAFWILGLRSIEQMKLDNMQTPE